MTVHVSCPARSLPSPVLVRFVADGLLAAVESFRRDELPLPRLARELRARTDVLAELGPPARTLTRLRWLHREVCRLDHALRDAGRAGLDAAERRRLEATLDSFRATLAALTPPDPLGPLSAQVDPAASGGWLAAATASPVDARSAGA